MRLLRLLQALQLLLAIRRDRQPGIVRNHGRRRAAAGPVDEESRDVVDRDAVNQRLQKIRAGGKEREESDQEEAFPVRPCQLKQNAPRTHVVESNSHPRRADFREVGG